MKLIVALFLSLIAPFSLLYAPEGDIGTIERQITEKEAERVKTESELKKATQEAEAAKKEREKNETEKEELLKQPEGQRNQARIDQLTEEIKKHESVEKTADQTIKEETAKKDQIEKDIAELKKQEQQIQQGFTPAGGSGTEAGFIERLLLKVQGWAKTLSLTWGLGNVKELRTDLNAIYEKLGDPYSQATNARALARELPAIEDKIGQDLSALNLLSEANKAGKNKELIAKEVKETVNDLVELRNALSTQEFVEDSVIRNQINDAIDKVLKELGFSDMQIKQLTAKPTPEEINASLKYYENFFDIAAEYDGFKEIRDNALEEIKKDPIKAESGENYQELMKMVEAVDRSYPVGIPLEERANVVSLVKATYQDLAQTYFNAAVELGKKQGATQQEVNATLDLFDKSNKFFELSQAMDVALQDALEQERQEAKDDADYQKLVDANKDAKIVSQQVADIAKTAASEIATIKASLDNPVAGKGVFDSFLKRVDEFISQVDAADPSVEAVLSSVKIAHQLTKLMNAIDFKTQEKTLSNPDLKILADWMLKLQDRRTKLLVDENSNQNDLMHTLPTSKKVVELEQVKKENVKSPLAETNAGRALLAEIQKGKELKKVVEESRKSITPQNQDEIINTLAKAMVARRAFLEGEGQGGEEGGEEGGGGWGGIKQVAEI
jgi:DNA repair exonuclease SbcCD ATPase subunit